MRLRRPGVGALALLAFLGTQAGCDDRLPSVSTDAAVSDAGVRDTSNTDGHARPDSNLLADARYQPDQGGTDCFDNNECLEDQFCRLPDGCGLFDAGRCVPLPLGCDDEYAPVCGCDGETYSNRCEAEASGQNVSHPGSCEAFEACRELEETYAEAVTAAKICQRDLSRLHCKGVVRDSLVCGCPTRVDGPIDELNRVLNELVDAWEELGCSDSAPVCSGCPPEPPLGICLPDASGNLSGTCQDVWG